MHLPDHYLDPAISTTTAIVSAGALAYAAIRIRRGMTPTVLPAAAVAAGIFAAQMLNYPVASGTSGHLVGGALAGMLLGPWVGLWAMASVLAVQAIVFGDGGILALGANILNMGVIGVAIGAGVERLLGAASRAAPARVHPGLPACATGYARACHFTGETGGTRRIGANTLAVVRASAAALAGWLSVVAAALACALEMALSGTAAATQVVPAMTSVHALIGLGEGAITALVVATVAYAVRTSALADERHHLRSRTDRAIGQCLPTLRTGALLIAIILVALSPLASSLPDGLERVAQSLAGEVRDAAIVHSLLPDYALPGIAWPPASTALAGLAGVLLVYCVAGAAAFAWLRSGAIDLPVTK